MEQWRIIEEFPRYEVSNLGRIVNRRSGRLMCTSVNNYGHLKISLADDYGRRLTRSVAMLVADAFVEAPNSLCDSLIVLDGDITHIEASNLSWRPTGFAQMYSRQLKKRQPIYYRNLVVANLNTGATYRSIIEAGMTEGLLFDDIWRSTYTGARIFPHGHAFEVIDTT